MNIITRKQIEIKYKDDIKTMKKEGFSKTYIKNFISRMLYKELNELRSQARATQIYITTDPKTGKQYKSIRVMTRKIARNMARQQAGGNKGMGDIFRSIFLPIRNFDKDHVKEIVNRADNQRREARLLKGGK